MNAEYTKKWLKIPSNIRTLVNNYMSRYEEPAYKAVVHPTGTNYKVSVNVYSIEQLEKHLSNKQRKSNGLEVAIHYLKHSELINYKLNNKHKYEDRLVESGRDKNLVYVWRTKTPLKYRIYRMLGKNGNILDGEQKFLDYYEDEYYKILNYLDDILETRSITQFAIETIKYTKYDNEAAYAAFIRTIRNSMPSHNKKRIKSMSKLRKIIKRYENES